MKRLFRPMCLGTAIAAAMLCTSLAHADGIFLTFEGANPAIPGYSTARGYEGQIEVDSFQWGVGVGISRSGGRPEASRPSFSDITWTQGLNPNYTALSQALVRGQDDYKAVFRFPRYLNGAPQQNPYLELTTEQTAISGLSFSSGGGTQSVSVSQAFRKYAMKYVPTDPTSGKDKAAVETKYDSVTNETAGQGSGSGAPVVDGSLPGGSRSAAGLYLFLGKDLGGESVVEGYKNWIELSSAQMGMGIGLMPNTGPGGGFLASRPSLSELTVTQLFDRSVIGMLGTLTSGTMIEEARLELVENTGSGSVTTMQLKMTDVFISGLSMSSGGDRMQVSESLNFGAYEQTIWQIGADGRRGGASVFSYDTVTGRSSYTSVSQAQGVALPEFGAGMIEPPVGASPIPEPHAWALMAGGVAMLLVVRRRRQGGANHSR